MYHVLAHSACIDLGIIDQEGGSLEHHATGRQISARAESSHADYSSAVVAARATGADRWVIDEYGDSEWISPGIEAR